MNITQEQLTTLSSSLIPFGITSVELKGQNDKNGRFDNTQDFRLLLIEDTYVLFYVLVSIEPSLIQCISFIGVSIYKGTSIEDCFKEIKELLIKETERTKKELNLVN